jgi:hypothetical protein
MHRLLQFVSPTGQETTQAPCRHEVPAAQTCPQPPQFRLSLITLTHCVPHAIWPEGHAHFPLLHTCPPRQALPQAPQLAGSPVGLLQHGTVPVCLHMPGGAGSVSAAASTGKSKATELAASPPSMLRRERGAAMVRAKFSNQRSDQANLFTPLKDSR